MNFDAVFTEIRIRPCYAYVLRVFKGVQVASLLFLSPSRLQVLEY